MYTHVFICRSISIPLSKHMYKLGCIPCNAYITCLHTSYRYTSSVSDTVQSICDRAQTPAAELHGGACSRGESCGACFFVENMLDV